MKTNSKTLMNSILYAKDEQIPVWSNKIIFLYSKLVLFSVFQRNWLVNPCGVILCLEVKKLSSLDAYIYIFV